MYKITLYDDNCNPICDGMSFWFVEDLQTFEKNWVPLQGRRDIATVERYYRSKFGEMVTDYMSDDPELNIVQSAESQVLSEKKYVYADKEVELVNTWGFKSNVGFDKLTISLRVVRYADECYLVGQYKGVGCKGTDPTWNRWYEKETKYRPMSFYGNPIANYVTRTDSLKIWDDPDKCKDYYTDDKSFYQYDTVETFVWIPIKKVPEDYKIRALTKKELALLMRDIIGEAG